MLVIVVIGAAVAPFLIFLIYKMRIGHSMGVHTGLFETAYDSALKEHGSRKRALREALVVFRTCPRLKSLSGSDIERIVNIIGDGYDPKRIMTKIIMGLDSTKALAALKDERFLRDIAAICKKQPQVEVFDKTDRQKSGKLQGISQAYLRSAEHGFQLAHDFICLRDELNKQAGTTASFIKGFFRKVDYDGFAERAKQIKDGVQILRESASSLTSPDSELHREFRQSLENYIVALLAATDIFCRKAQFLARKAAGATKSEMDWSTFREIVDEEKHLLQQCQTTGDRLTGLYRGAQDNTP